MEQLIRSLARGGKAGTRDEWVFVAGSLSSKLDRLEAEHKRMSFKVSALLLAREMMFAALGELGEGPGGGIDKLGKVDENWPGAVRKVAISWEPPKCETETKPSKDTKRRGLIRKGC